MALLILLLLTLTSFTFADEVYVIEEEDSFEESAVVLYDEESANKQKNLWGTAALNLALPGSGHLYLGDKKRAALYFTTEALFFSGMLFSERTSRRFYEDARAIAYRYAHTKTDREDDDAYWLHIGNSAIDNSDSWNEAMDQIGNAENKYLEDKDQWDWESSSDKARYSEARGDAKDWHERWSFFVGAMVLNRAIAFVDGRISAQRYNESLLKDVTIAPIITPNKHEGGIFLSYQF